jgi:hypothetical protein
MSCISSDESGELRASKFGLCTAANFEPGGQSFTNTRSSKAQSIRCADDSNFFASHYPPSRVLEDLSLIFSIFAQSQREAQFNMSYNPYGGKSIPQLVALHSDSC